MPRDAKAVRTRRRESTRTWIQMPAIGMESEFNVWVDGKEVVPETYWNHPRKFIGVPMLKRTRKSSQLPTGGAVYFDRGVIEVVTPLVELAPGASARVVRSLWEQIGYVRDSLTRWEEKNGHEVRLKAYSSHYNVSYEIPKRRQSKERNLRRLALLLAYILPAPIMILGTNRRSTGVGVRPRGNRVEITVDFTPDPALMITTMALIAGIVREVMTWPTYRLGLLNQLPIPTVAHVHPGRHTTRKGWLTKDIHFPQSPFTSDIDAPLWKVRDGRKLSMRRIALETAWFFRESIREFSDPHVYRLLFAVLEGRAPSMLDLADRPEAYEDVGRLCRWGRVIDELRWFNGPQAYTGTTEVAPAARVAVRTVRRVKPAGKSAPQLRVRPVRRSRRRAAAGTQTARKPRSTSRARRADIPADQFDPATLQWIDRRSAKTKRLGPERRKRGDRRKKNHFAAPFPDRRMRRSAYEQVFLILVSGRKLKIGRELYRPIGMKGWYHAIFRAESDGRERVMTIDQLLQRMNDWV